MRGFISSSLKDREFSNTLSKLLQENGYEIESSDYKKSGPGSVFDLLNAHMKSPDIFIVVWSQALSHSGGVGFELSVIKTLVDTDESKYICPIILDDAEIPIEFSRYNYIKTSKLKPDFARILAHLKRFETLNDPTVKKGKDNPPTPDIEPLRKAHQEGTLTLVCGAGISIEANIPTWSTLLDRLLDAMLGRLVTGKTDIAAARSELNDIRENSSLIAGRYLKNVLKDDFQEEVRRALYEGSDQSCAIIDSIVDLARPKRGKAWLDSIISFNFDDLLERNFSTASIEHKPIFSEGSRVAATELPIYHVHGYLPKLGKLHKENQIVFSEDSYHDQFVDPFRAVSFHSGS